MRSRPIDEALAAAVQQGLTPGAVATVFSRTGEIYAGAAGAAASRPLRRSDVFRIASMTKLVTSVAVLMLVDEGRVSLDRPLSHYLQGFRQPEVLVRCEVSTGRCITRPARREATLRELLSHTGGYGYWFLDEPLRVVSGSAPNLFDPPFLMHEPGAGFAYSTSHDTAGLVVAATTGLELDRYFADRIFAPLGMHDTSFEPPADPGRLVAVAQRAGDGFVWLDNETHGHAPRGGGGLYSTAEDYMRLLRCLLAGGEPLLTAAAAAEIGRNQIGDLFATRQLTALPERTNDFLFMDGTQKFGLGVMIETRDRPGKRARDSFGWGGIFNSYFWIDPRTGIGSVLLMQLQPFADPGCVAALGSFEAAVYASL